MCWLVSVRSVYFSERIFIPGAENLEIMFVRVRMNVNIYICCLYIPPGSDSYVFQQYLDVFKSFIDSTLSKFDDIILICCDCCP